MIIGVAQAMSVVGVEGHPVRIEAAILSGLPSFTIVGLPDTAVSESRERLRAAFAASGITFPSARLTVNLSPADTPKTGTGFDLGIAVAILGAMGGRSSESGTYLLGELGLDGSVRRVRGVLPAALAAHREQAQRMIVPWGSGGEAELAHVPATEVWHLSQLAVAAGVTCSGIPKEPVPYSESQAATESLPDLCDVRGQVEARRALEVAAAGGHHLLMTGAPGIGKSMLACRLPGILPALSTDEAVEVAAIASVTGDFTGRISHVPPIAAPHHTASAVALVGGGSVPRPGAASRAHRGVLFLDELPEFSTHALQALRQPMESGRVEIHRARATVSFPASFQLIGAANPCRCGRYLDGPGKCTCSVRERRDYFRRIGGPLLDRFDLNVVLHRPSRAALAMAGEPEPSARVAERVLRARERQRRRLAGTPWTRNAQVPGTWLRRHVDVPQAVVRDLDRALAQGEVTMRAVDKVFRLAWTIADLAGHDSPDQGDFHQAFTYRLRGGFYGAA
ncbi:MULTISPECIES: YifB family Mg chelatase-like AAA ATPase [unclassified Actinobaculum]|uniref:YifB family Mg chelatase-like AAA ATPase n=1 Tax=unclassified Actinobaculum TaxID=2609299 RepID=UPI000D526909|nr:MULTISPECIES: YifB family Mg chelatase-like AAA ATPase [unclassified Actinobaculum]AWE42671.1 magnesium chelatase [Actinobaculum sp. 313]RTE49481.1 ATP-binding protein [Actinobaculum sp. 352]